MTGEGRVYPLRGAVHVLVRNEADHAQARIGELEAIAPLCGAGKDVGEALRALFWELHRLVEEHWWAPPHARTDEDHRVCRALEQLIDWDRYAAENPVEQPLWGRIDATLAGGGLRVHWFMGPDADRGEYDGTLAAADLHPALRSMRVGEWFLGSGRRFPDRLAWTVAPEAVPDPRDEEARQAAWDRVPVGVMNDADAWPARKGD
jgi:hypothetical protein